MKMTCVWLGVCTALMASVACSAKTATPVNHRVSDAACSSTALAGNYTCASDCNVGAYAPECTSDADCTEGAQGRCIRSGGGPAGPPAACTYDRCTTDADCISDKICACHGSPYFGPLGNQCVIGNCRVDADCGQGGWCSPSPSSESCGGFDLAGFYCHTSKDMCTNDTDCEDGGVCAFDVVLLLWQCAGPVVECT